MTHPLRSLPSVDRVLSHPAVAALALPAELVADAVREELQQRRAWILAAEGDAPVPSLDAIAESIAERLSARFAPSLRSVINATGVVIHTNLGRAPLSDAATAAMQEAARYSNLEFDLESGERGSRAHHLDEPLRALTGAEAALVVNNNAAALYLALAAHVGEGEVIISRGQAVEIGGGFRIPDVLRQSGAKLVEVGATNRTRAADYEQAITERTAALLRVHSSNFRIVGFTEEASLAELREIARRRSISQVALNEPPLLLFDDIGSGCLLETRGYGLIHEPQPQESVAAGADLVMFSGDKLLGGPQAGIIVGREEVVAPLRSHPLMRALRPDKTTIAALAATLQHYLRGEAESEIPVWRMIAAEADELRGHAESWRAQLDVGEVVADESPIGGGSLPGETRPTWVLRLADDGLAKRLRGGDPPIVARVVDGGAQLDPRTVLPDQEAALLSGIRAAIAGGRRA